MKLFTGWVMSAGLVLTATGANAQVLAPHESGRSPYSAVSDIDDPYVAMPQEAPPYAAMPEEAPAPRYGYGYGYRPALLPVPEVYAILRESGFSPLGIPQLRGFVYTISVIDRDGDDGRLVIDARTGRIIRFMPAYRMGDNFHEDLMVTHGPAGPLPPITAVRGPPRPPASVPHVASRTPSVPMPKAAPRAGEPPKPLAAKPAPEPAQQSAAVQAKPADAQAAAPAAVEAKPAAPQTQPAQQSAAVQAKPADAAQTVPQAAAPAAVEAKPVTPQIQPTQEMPKAQGLE